MQIRDIRWLQVGAGLLLGCALTLIYVTLSNQVRPAPIQILPAPTATSLLPTTTPTPYSIYVNGEVHQPGVYVIPHTGRVQDVVQAAGGFTDVAWSDAVNLALPLSDGLQIFVPSVEDVGSSSGEVLLQRVVGSAEANNANTATINTSNAIDANGIVDINRASRAELETLPGIGESTAQKIVTYREDNGPFAAIDEIMNVSGVGEGKFNQMKDLIRTGQ
ncbi:MAG: helix-hairpin-helix domain-containing protein [Candidatus Promineifilaceae bacterium]